MHTSPRSGLLFAGPTLYRTQASAKVELDGLTVLPPVRRGDIGRVLREAGGRPGVMILVDGYFHLSNLAVGHAEIRTALQRGWTVWGLSSMGAIRACELRHLGMRGFGQVFAMYCGEEDFRDDEVALLHEPEPPYREASEPLVHLRCALAELVVQGLLSSAEAAAIVAELMGMWFGDRTLACLRDLILARRPGQEAAVGRFFQGFDRYRLKCHDLLAFLRGRVWMTPQPTAPL